MLIAGYESEEPEILLPVGLAKRLGFEVAGLRGVRYRSVGGEALVFLLGRVDVRVVAGDRCSEWVSARAVCVPGEYEVLLSNALIEALGVEIARPFSGLWRFAGEDRLRRSVEPFYWLG